MSYNSVCLRKMRMAVTLMITALLLPGCYYWVEDHSEPELNVEFNSVVNVSWEGEKFSIEIFSTRDWEVSNVPGWFEIEPVRGGKGTHTLTVTVRENPGDERYDTFVVKAEDLWRNVTLRQNGEDLYPLLRDDDFRLAVMLTGADGYDGLLSEGDAKRLLYLDVSNKSIESLDGIGIFSNLTDLRCDRNNITSLDVTSLGGLVEVVCGDNPGLGTVSIGDGVERLSAARCDISSLNLGNKTGLKTLELNDNPLTSLVVAGCTGLESLAVEDTPLTTLDISAATDLRELYAAGSQITTIYVWWDGGEAARPGQFTVWDVPAGVQVVRKGLRTTTGMQYRTVPVQDTGIVLSK